MALEGKYLGPDGKWYDAGASGWDPQSGSATGGRWGLSYALMDPASGASDMYYYGQDRGFAEDDAARLRADAGQLGRRAGITANFSGADQITGMQGEYASDLERAMAGDPYSAAQRQLRANTNAGQAALLSRAATGTGGLAQAAALEAAGQGQGQLRAQAGVDAYGLMQKERMDAMGAYGSNADAMRAAGLSQAMGQAGLDARQRALNDAARAQAEKQEFRTLQAGMQGEIARRGAHARATATAIGGSAAAAEKAQEVANRSSATTMGAVTGAAQGLGTIAQRYGQQDTPAAAPKPVAPQPAYNPDENKGYRW